MTTTPLKVLIVTGLSGAGKTSALKSLEDMGYETVDNLPLSLLGSLVRPGDPAVATGPFLRPLAVGIDIRTRDFAVPAFMETLAQLRKLSDVEARLLFLDCADDDLIRRYAETRHRHPLAVDRSLAEGIAAERALLAPLRQSADVVADSSAMTLGALKQTLQRHFALDQDLPFVVFVTSFSYRRGLPRESDLVLDLRFLATANAPSGNGTDRAVQEFIAADTAFVEFFARLTAFLAPLLPRYAAEGKSYLTIAVGSEDGRRRSVVVAERLATWLGRQGWRTHLQHRDLDGRAADKRVPEGETGRT
jgi:UPF0042 nucleotide-binding protein